MSYYQAFDPATELVGHSVLAFTTNIMHEDIAEILEKHNLAQVDPSRWYSLQKVLDVLSDISRETNSMSNFVSIGMAAAKHGYEAMPDAAKGLPLDAFLKHYTIAYKDRLRNGDVGEVEFEKVNDKHYILRLRVPFPDDVFYGVIYGYVRLFRPQNQSFSVKYDDRIPRRDQGGDVTVLHVQMD